MRGKPNALIRALASTKWITKKARKVSRAFRDEEVALIQQQRRLQLSSR
jgi:hypothetical protein